VPHWTAIDWNPFVGDRTVEGTRIRFVDYGSGPPLVLLHGLGNSWQWWVENLPALGERHRVIAVDLPGFGHSDPLPAPAEMSTHARVICGLLRQLEVHSATVLGHSMGGLVALNMATADRQLVQKLVLVGAGGVPMTERRLSIVLVLLRLCYAVLRLRFVRHLLATKPWALRLLLRGAVHNPRAISPELATFTAPSLNAPGFIGAVAASGRAVRASVPEAITCPVLLLWGEHDRLAPLPSAEDMHARLPDSRLVVVEGVGHIVQWEAPQRFNDAVLSFTAPAP
jgi:pimeloyl-ACP methyl ester carboxylesterase